MITQLHTRSAFAVILIGGLIAGTLDILSAFALSGVSAERVLRFVAGGWFGRDAAMSGGSHIIALGLLFHYLIAFAWTTSYFFIFPRLYALMSNRLVLAIVCGLVIWTVMNLIVLPLSALPPLPVTLKGFAQGASVLTLALGVPLTWIFKAYYFPKR